MTTVLLSRYVTRGDGVFGWLTVNGFSCFTLERPWLTNMAEVSCIPAGTYKLAFTYSPKFARSLWEVLDVPGRAGIRIHPANRFGELEGCIALADSITRDGQGWCLNNTSRATVEAFQAVMKDLSDPILSILDAPGPETHLPTSAGPPTGPQ